MTDYESFAPLYHQVSVSLLVVDYRAYGWSTGTPSTTQLLPDAQKVLDSMDTILKDCGVVPGRNIFPDGTVARERSGNLSGDDKSPIS